MVQWLRVGLCHALGAPAALGAVKSTEKELQENVVEDRRQLHHSSSLDLPDASESHVAAALAAHHQTLPMQHLRQSCSHDDGNACVEEGMQVLHALTCEGAAAVEVAVVAQNRPVYQYSCQRGCALVQIRTADQVTGECASAEMQLAERSAPHSRRESQLQVECLLWHRATRCQIQHSRKFQVARCIASYAVALCGGC